MGNKCSPCFSLKYENIPDVGVENNTPDVGVENTPGVENIPSVGVEKTPDTGVENTPGVENIPSVGVENSPTVGVEKNPIVGVPYEVVEDEITLDIRNLSEAFKDTSDIDRLISFIQKRLEALTDDTTTSRGPSTSQQNAGTPHKPVGASPKWRTRFDTAGNLLLNLVKRVQKDTPEGPFTVKFGDKMRKSVIDILKESVKIHWLGIGLSVVGYVLEYIDQVHANKKQCVSLLRYMLALAKHVRKLNEELPENREKLNDVVDFIVQGCLMCVSQMTNHRLFRFISASVDAEEIKDFESQLGQKYQDLTMDAVIGLLNRTPQFLPPTQGREPDAVGIQNARETVTQLLQVEVNDQTRRAVVIYGFGGVGKTTLATAVFNKLKLKSNNYKFSRLDMEESCSDNHIKLLQQQLLRDLFRQNILLTSHVEGRIRLTDAFLGAPTQSVFLFIDNALKKEDLAKLLPENLSCLPKQTRILLTLRKLDESSMLLQQGIQRHEYMVECLDNAASNKILCRKALGSANATFQPGVDIDGLVEICGGIPLVLDLVGSRLSEHVNDVSVCNEMIDSLRESLIEGEGDEGEEISEKVVDVVYNTLNENCKEAFLDIACFFYNSERRLVSCVVGELQLKTLVNAALVKISYDPPSSISLWSAETSLRWQKFARDRDVREGFLEVHDIVRARARKLSQTQSNRRIMDMESLAEAVQDPQNLQKVKGIVIRHPTSEVQIDAGHLDLMHASLRTLYIGGKIKMNGKCQKDFKNLRCIYLDYKTSFCVDLAKLKRLRVLRVGFSNNPTQLPSSLHWLELAALLGFQLSLNETFGKLSSLQQLQLKNDVVVPPNFGHLKSLSILNFIDCKMVTLPQSFGSLSALEGLSIDRCWELESLPMSFGELEKLAFLEMSYCHKLSSLSENFGQLTSLKTLLLNSCDGLSTLPESFGNLSSLEELSLEGCSELVSLPESFGNLSYLKKLNMPYCEKLASLPSNFGQLKLLEELDISSCCGLERLWSDCGCLISLRMLEAGGCSDLKEEAMDVLVEMKSLEELYIGESPMLMKRWKELGEPLLASGSSIRVFL